MWKPRQYLLITALPLIAALLFASWIVSSIHNRSFALSAEEVIDLKKAGVDDRTIEIIIHEQADITGQINVQEVIRMKQAGVSNQVIRAIASPRISRGNVKEYGTHVGSIQEISTRDLIQLKEAGFDDNLIEAVIRMQREDRWPFLLDLGIIKCPENER
jgi:hypothetical protein